MAFSSSGGSISTATDVVLSSPAGDQVLTYDAPAAKWKNNSVGIVGVVGLQAELNTREVVVRWSGTSWGVRPAAALFGVVFLSTNDPAAAAPTDANLKVGDVWRRHPDAG